MVALHVLFALEGLVGRRIHRRIGVGVSRRWELPRCPSGGARRSFPTPDVGFVCPDLTTVGAGQITDKQKDRLTNLFALDEYVEVKATWGIRLGPASRVR